VDTDDATAGQRFAQPTDDGFDFGQLRHGRARNLPHVRAAGVPEGDCSPRGRDLRILGSGSGIE
jgi:hypothetical protein